jgi:hypothetical protein
MLHSGMHFIGCLSRVYGRIVQMLINQINVLTLHLNHILHIQEHLLQLLNTLSDFYNFLMSVFDILKSAPCLAPSFAIQYLDSRVHLVLITRIFGPKAYLLREKWLRIVFV